MVQGSSRPPALIVAALAIMLSVALLAAIPPTAGMGLAVVAAVSWCIWLDRHPTA